jgi:glycolate oxidase FAD binding subunit
MTSTTINVAGRLEGLIGATHVSGSTEFCEQYSIDGVVPGAVAAPSSVPEVAEIVSFARAEKLALVACGHRTKLSSGMPPHRYDFAVDMSGLHEVAYYDPADLTLSVDAGIGLAQLAEVLARQNQFVPLAVPFFENCTVGGTIVSGIASALRPGYGSARDFLLGAEFVNGTGALTKSGGRVVKNVTGYDLHKLLIGSLGTLAVITRLNFRTFPLPRGFGRLRIAFSSVEAILRFRAMVAQSPLTPSSFEILDPEASRRLLEGRKDQAAVTPSWFTPKLWHIFVGFEGTDRILRRYSSDLSQYAEQSGAANWNLLDEAASKLVAKDLQEFPKFLASASPAATIFKLSALPVLPPDILNLCAGAQRRAIPCCLFANNSGPLYFALQPAKLDDAAIAALAEISAEVFAFAAAHRGQASIPFCPTQLKRRINTWGPAREDADLMRRVKNAFDPDNIFAPGRFTAGI